MNMLILIAYVALMTSMFVIIRKKLLKDLIKKHVVTPTSAKELSSLLDVVYVVLVIIGSFVGIISEHALAFLLVTIILMIPFLLYDMLKSLVYYYVLVVTKVVNVGNFVILTRGIRGWIKRITPFFVELRGEYEETIRVPNSLVVNEHVRIPSRSLPFTLNIRLIGVKDFNKAKEAIKDAVIHTKRYSVIEPKIKLRSLGDDWMEYEIMYGLGNYEVTDEIMISLLSRLKRLLGEEIKIEVKREHAIMSR